MTSQNHAASRRKWNFRPKLDEQLAPFYHWPPRIIPALRYVLASWSPFGVRIHVLGFAVITWFYLSPQLQDCREFRLDWIAQIWGRNLLTMLVVAGGLHLYFYTLRRQQDDEHYDLRPLMRNSRLFHFNDQVRDNMFWTLVSAVGVWSAYESVMMYAYANAYAPLISFAEHPVWFVSLLFLIPWWAGLHFYSQHRLLHSPWLYATVHSWHHKNSNTTSWSGPAMHPVEHLVWLSSVFALLLLPSHPLHAIFILQFHMISAATSHVGYENLRLGKRAKLRLGDFFHQLHHRYCDCNYGTFETPWDQWLDTYHDGTEAGDTWMKERRRQLSQQKATA
jgi:sterol desaturase/sphingolipid hydroxylase (fatty acid hydroxylase superfamily)